MFYWCGCHGAVNHTCCPAEQCHRYLLWPDQLLPSPNLSLSPPAAGAAISGHKPCPQDCRSPHTRATSFALLRELVFPRGPRGEAAERRSLCHSEHSPDKCDLRPVNSLHPPDKVVLWVFFKSKALETTRESHLPAAGRAEDYQGHQPWHPGTQRSAVGAGGNWVGIRLFAQTVCSHGYCYGDETRQNTGGWLHLPALSRVQG